MWAANVSSSEKEKYMSLKSNFSRSLLLLGCATSLCAAAWAVTLIYSDNTSSSATSFSSWASLKGNQFNYSGSSVTIKVKAFTTGGGFGNNASSYIRAYSYNYSTGTRLTGSSIPISSTQSTYTINVPVSAITGNAVGVGIEGYTAQQYSDPNWYTLNANTYQVYN